MEEKTIYYISEAAKKVQVESHVLRYWEDELQLPIKRNEMGHRYYTEQDIKQLQQVRMLKEQGLQLKAIRTVLFKVPPMSVGGIQGGSQADGKEKIEMEMVSESKVMENEVEVRKGKLPDVVADKEQKAARLQYLLKHMITEAVKSANRELCTDVKDSILKELDYQFRLQEERADERWKQEEEHYRKIDEMIRERHKAREKLIKGKKKT